MGTQSLDRRNFMRLLSVASGGVVVGMAGCTAGSDGQGEKPSSQSKGRIPEPPSALLTRWGADYYSLGNYSYLAKGSQPEDRSLLASSLEDRVFFAGETTSTDYPSTGLADAFEPIRRLVTHWTSEAHGSTVFRVIR